MSDRTLKYRDIVRFKKIIKPPKGTTKTFKFSLEDFREQFEHFNAFLTNIMKLFNKYKSCLYGVFNKGY